MKMKNQLLNKVNIMRFNKKETRNVLEEFVKHIPIMSLQETAKKAVFFCNNPISSMNDKPQMILSTSAPRDINKVDEAHRQEIVEVQDIFYFYEVRDDSSRNLAYKVTLTLSVNQMDKSLINYLYIGYQRIGYKFTLETIKSTEDAKYKITTLSESDYYDISRNHVGWSLPRDSEDTMYYFVYELGKRLHYAEEKMNESSMYVLTLEDVYQHFISEFRAVKDKYDVDKNKKILVKFYQKYYHTGFRYNVSVKIMVDEYIAALPYDNNKDKIILEDFTYLKFKPEIIKDIKIWMERYHGVRFTK